MTIVTTQAGKEYIKVLASLAVMDHADARDHQPQVISFALTKAHTPHYESESGAMLNTHILDTHDIHTRASVECSHISQTHKLIIFTMGFVSAILMMFFMILDKLSHYFSKTPFLIPIFLCLTLIFVFVCIVKYYYPTIISWRARFISFFISSSIPRDLLFNAHNSHYDQPDSSKPFILCSKAHKLGTTTILCQDRDGENIIVGHAFREYRRHEQCFSIDD